jgi:hypothetical protein
MAKKDRMDLGLMFSAAAIIADGNPQAFIAILKCFVHAAQPDVPYWKKTGHHNDLHTPKTRLLVQNHK